MVHVPGLFGWVDLSTSDVPAAQAFYTALFGWTYEEIPTPMGPSYSMCRLGEDVVAGIAPQPPGMADSGAPSTWNSYVLVEDAEATCAAARAAGGTVLMAPADVMDQGRLAVLADPSGAVVGLWQPGVHPGASLFNAPGTLSWNELETRGLEAALPFYEQVFGWRFEPGDDSGYLTIALDAKPGEDKMNGGAMAMPPGVPDEVPSFWAVYFAVEDCAAALERSVELGGTATVPMMEMGAGTFAGIEDPTGAFLFLAAFPDS